MPVTKSPREYTAPDLVKEWRKRVNQNIAMGRDAHLIKMKLEYLTPVQVLLGIYCYVGEETVSIPQFLQQEEDWIEEDTEAAEIELAAAITKSTPPAYRIWRDLRYEEPTTSNLRAYREAMSELREWVERILS